jgi:hypothetical protein
MSFIAEWFKEREWKKSVREGEKEARSTKKNRSSRANVQSFLYYTMPLHPRCSTKYRDSARSTTATITMDAGDRKYNGSARSATNLNHERDRKNNFKQGS